MTFLLSKKVLLYPRYVASCSANMTVYVELTQCDKENLNLNYIDTGVLKLVK